MAALMVVSMLVIGPWPVDDASPDGSLYQTRTLDRLEATPGVGPAGPIRIGLAEVDLTPRSPRPLAGFIGQVRTPFVGVDSPCLARALTIQSEPSSVTVLTADLLLINAKLARAVVDRAGLRPEEVYFTASHTHGGPGGWGDHPLEMLVAGLYDPAYFDELAGRLADVICRSRASTTRAELAFVEVAAPSRQKNRIDPALPTHDALSALVFRQVGAAYDAPPLAILTVFGAHATVSHPVPPRLGADYPASLVADLKRRTGAGAVLFAAGAVGDASPARPKATTQRESAEALGISLAGDLMAALPFSRFSEAVEVGSLRLEVDLPPLRLPFFASWLRFSPAASWWIADRRTHLHALRIGPAVLVGFPGDYSGHLADRLTASTRASGLSTVATSFDGDYKGYFVSGEIFRLRPCYETRWMSFYGPWTGDYLTDLGRRMVERLASGSPGSPRSTMASGEFERQIALASLLTSVAIGGWRRRREFVDRARWPGFVTLAMIAVATVTLLGFLIDADRVAWASVGLPGWAWPMGIPIGLLALVRWPRWGSGKGLFVLGLACFLLSSSWLVALAALRVWLDAGTGVRVTLRAGGVMSQASNAIAGHQS